MNAARIPTAASRIKDLAARHGFPLSGIAAVPEDGAAPRAAALQRWLALGRHGPLDYVAQSAAARARIRTRFPWARGVLALGAFYASEPRGRRGEDLVAHVARYARGRDYHLVFARRLKALERALVAGGCCSRTRRYSDTGPILERAWAEAAGLGWIGKNTCLIHPRLGSFMLLAEILLDALPEPDPPESGHCGSCTRCLDACPTGALPEPGVLDARRCIVTWNLEQKGAVPEARWAEHHGWAAGCDICQAVCPYNAPGRAAPGDPELLRPLPWQGLSLAEAIEMDEPRFDTAFRASALRRTGWKGLRLGAITVAGNVRAESARAALERCLADPDPDIRTRAHWALRQQGSEQKG